MFRQGQLAVHGLAILLGRNEAGISNRGKTFLHHAVCRKKILPTVAMSTAVEIVQRGAKKVSPCLKFPPHFCQAKWPAHAQPIGPDGTCVTQLSSINFARPCTWYALTKFTGGSLSFLRASKQFESTNTKTARYLGLYKKRASVTCVYRGVLKYTSQVLWIWDEQVAFSCLQQAGERNFSPHIHRTWEAYKAH